MEVVLVGLEDRGYLVVLVGLEDRGYLVVLGGLEGLVGWTTQKRR